MENIKRLEEQLYVNSNNDVVFIALMDTHYSCDEKKKTYKRTEQWLFHSFDVKVGDEIVYIVK